MYDYLMNTASFIYIICYVPELYANWKNQNANIYNLPEKVLMVFGTSLAFSYSVLNQDRSLIINYTPILVFDILSFTMRGYYVWKNSTRVQLVEDHVDTSDVVAEVSETP
jgi:uncharacterized protein with PQ loop repeat